MAFAITWLTIPSIVHISRVKGLYDNPNGRTSHFKPTPTLGGIAVFAGIILSTVFFAGTYFIFELKYIITGLIIVFFMGVKDDILIIDPLKKFAGQIFAIVLVAFFADIRITNLYGLFNIEQLPYIVSLLLTFFVYIVIINSFNLIDGIDGLAAGTGILTSSIFGIWFWLNGNIAYTIFSFSIAGSLLAFFYFNVFSKNNKLFLGDSGSLIIGLVMGVLTCRFLQPDLISNGMYIQSAPAVAIGILIVPLFDTFRVFILRIIQGKSPFTADKQHLHHRLLQLGNTHLQATLILISVNLIFVVLSYLLQGIGIVWLTSVIIGLASLMSYILTILVKKKTNEADFLYYFLEIRREINKKKRTIKISEKGVVLSPRQKVNSDLN